MDAIPEQIETVFAHMPQRMREVALDVRRMIFEEAAADKRVGQIEETLKWGSPAYLTHKPKSGTTIRLYGHSEQKELTGNLGVYVHCQTNLIERARGIFGSALSYSGNRAVLIDPDIKLPEAELRHFIALALTYHLNKDET